MNNNSESDRRYAVGFSLVGSICIIGFLFITNYLTSWDHPWFIYPSFAVVWWPLTVYFGGQYGKALSIMGCLSIVAFSVVTNLTTSPSHIWFIYPSFAAIWWPLSAFLLKPRTAKIYSAVSALIILAFFAVDNYINSPDCPWMLFTIYPLLLWPVCVSLGRRALMLPTVIGLTVTGIVYYAVLNVFVFTGFPWIIFPIYALLWWPLSAAFAKRGHAMMFSVCGTLLSAALFIAINVISSPQILWAVYPIFLLAWWPLATYYFCYKRCRTPGFEK